MAGTGLYQASIPPVRRGLAALSGCLAKAADHFAAAGVPESEWLSASLAPDMFALTRQIQVSSDAAKLLAARLSGSEAPAMPDTETSVAELQVRIAATIAYLDSVPDSSIDGREAAPIVIPIPNGELRFTGASYVSDFGLPNFFFHTATAYGLMRHQGVPLGKIDYLGPLDMTRSG